MIKHFNIIVKGHVQNVGFRYYTHKNACMHGIKGTVKNSSDGNVCIEAEGEEMPLDDFVQWCRSGPALASVMDVVVEESGVVGYTSFEIIY